MKTSIIMPIYNINHELYQLTLNAIETLKADEHILIDNASVMNEIKNWPDVIVKNKTNKGYTGGVNQGLKLATGDLIAVVNNDIRVSKNWLSVVKEIFESDPKVGSVHFRMINYDEPITLGYNTWLGGKERWCTSSFFVIRKEAALLYDEFYGGGYDDYDYWYRVRQNGWKSAYTTKACYQHAHSATQRALDNGESRSKKDVENLEYFKKKFGKEPEELFSQMYPDQWKEDYWSFFTVL